MLRKLYKNISILISVILIIVFAVGCQGAEGDNWDKLVKYLNDKGAVVYNGVDKSANNAKYTVTMKAIDEKTIQALYVFEYGDSNAIQTMYTRIDFTAELVKNESTAKLNGEAKTYILSAKSKEKGSCDWNIETYRPGDSPEWTDYNMSGNKVDGSPIDQNSEGMIKDTAVSVKRMTEGVDGILKKTGLEISMSDIGFAGYNT